MNEFYVVARWSDGSVSHEAIQLVMRPIGVPEEPGFTQRPDGYWTRQPTLAVVNGYLARVAQRRLALDNVTLVGWRQLSEEEHLKFDQDREYRDALEDVDGKLQHNMTKARELHRHVLRHLNGARFLTMDREWVEQFAAGNRVAADAIEAKRQVRRALVNDPRIDAAQTIEDLKRVTPPDD